MKRCYIVGAGECGKIPMPSPDTLIIAADGGYDTLISAGIEPQILLGDLDSIKNIPANIETVRYRVKKDETDMHLAYLEGKRRGCGDFTIFGGLGGARLDHTLANLALLSFIKKAGDTARLAGVREDIILISCEGAEISGECGSYFSVFAYGGKAHGVSIKNAEYEVEDTDLTTDFPLGVSNRFLDTPATVSVERGELLIVISKQNAD